MGVTILLSTTVGGYSVICDSCGIKMDFDVSKEDYDRAKVVYDNYLCPECQEYPGVRRKGAVVMTPEVNILKRSTIIVKKVCGACSGTGICTVEEPECPRCFGQGFYLETISGVEYVQTINLNGVD